MKPTPNTTSLSGRDQDISNRLRHPKRCAILRDGRLEFLTSRALAILSRRRRRTISHAHVSRNASERLPSRPRRQPRPDRHRHALREFRARCLPRRAGADEYSRSADRGRSRRCCNQRLIRSRIDLPPALLGRRTDPRQFARVRAPPEYCPVSRESESDLSFPSAAARRWPNPFHEAPAKDSFRQGHRRSNPV